MSDPTLESIQKEKEYFIKRYNEEPDGEYKDQLWVFVILAMGMEEAWKERLQSSGETANEP